VLRPAHQAFGSRGVNPQASLKPVTKLAAAGGSEIEQQLPVGGREAVKMAIEVVARRQIQSVLRHVMCVQFDTAQRGHADGLRVLACQVPHRGARAGAHTEFLQAPHGIWLCAFLQRVREPRDEIDP
jgi:hypothetical protein